MIFCEKCFNDKIIADIIKSLPDALVGDCSICNHKDVYLYDTDKMNDLTPYFEDLLNIYSTKTTDNTLLEKAERIKLIDDLNQRWQLFSKSLTNDFALSILKSIVPELYKNEPQLFDGEVVIPGLYDEEYRKNHSLLKNNNWEDFVNEIKTKNRYHCKLINFEILEQYSSFIRKTFKKGKIFYRARNSNEKGFKPKEMSAPPVEKTIAGRANAQGIRCLYLGSDVDTTFHEIKANLFDYVSVGKFRLERDITVVDLRMITKISPFVENLGYLDHAINQEYLERLDLEISKPLRKNDVTLEYVPTQYIVDSIKNIEHNGKREYDGIVYRSTTYPNGYNLAIFEPDVFKCISVKNYEVKGIEYNKELLKKKK